MIDDACFFFPNCGIACVYSYTYAVKTVLVLLWFMLHLKLPNRQQFFHLASYSFLSFRLIRPFQVETFLIISVVCTSYMY